MLLIRAIIALAALAGLGMVTALAVAVADNLLALTL